MNSTYTDEQTAAARQLGFSSVELMLAYFTAKLLADGLYESLQSAE